ncbi:multidrug MFS transporter [Streptomyces ficellus]|uniref:Terpene synthase n=1 Tax=Streptomyces ficellus TaxID=1977088 RepID=A0ABT7ZCM0_9ACTN|nr:multidrug MFS transporter [Streptomyces ficellus]MDN3297261.1 multidrug MFS transporter [Streptomyces ficellus]
MPWPVGSPAVALSSIEAGFSRRLHPYWPTLQVRTRTWLRERQVMSPSIVERFADDLRYTDLVAGYYLGASNELLSAIADFSAWFFAWDDRHDRDVVHGRLGAWRKLCAALHAVLDDPDHHREHADPLVSALADCLIRVRSHVADTWSLRFTGHFHPVVDAYDREFHNRAHHAVPTVAQYVELRRLTFAHELWIDLLEPTAGSELPAYLRDDAAFRRAAMATQDFAAWYNDLCSLPKELAGDEVHNLAISLICHEGMSPGQAAAEVHRRVSECVETFLETEPAVMALADHTARTGTEGVRYAATIRSCLFNMRNWFSSVYWFHQESGRYRTQAWDDRSAPPYIDDPEGRS